MFPYNLVIEMGVGRCTGRQPLFEINGNLMFVCDIFVNIYMSNAWVRERIFLRPEEGSFNQ